MQADDTQLSRRTVLSVLTPFAASLTACGRRKPTQTIRVLTTRYIFMSGVYLAEESGYFEKEGIKVEIREEARSSSTSSTLPLLAAGDVDAAFLPIGAAVVNAVARGARLRIVAGRQYYATACPENRRMHGSLQAFPNGFNDIRQIRGKRICVGASAGASDFAFAACLKAAGLTRADVTIIKARDQEAAVLVASGKADVAFAASDELSLTPLRERVVPGPTHASVLPDFMNSYVLFGKKMLDGPPQDGARFLRAFLRGGREFVAGKDPKFLKDLIVANGWDPARVAAQCRNNIALDGHIALQDIQRFIDWSVEEGFTPSPIRAEELVDMRFLKEMRNV